MNTRSYSSQRSSSTSSGRRKGQDPPRKLTYLQHLGVESLCTGKDSTSDLPIAPAPAPAQAQTTAGSKTNMSANRKESTTTDQGPSAIPMETNNLLEEEEDILLEEPAPIQRDDKTLLALRQEYKKICTGMTRARSHLEFIQQCEEKENVPKGLRVNVKCNALLAEYTKVKENFALTKATAEKDFATHLREHYIKVLDKLEEDLNQLDQRMTTKASQVGPEERKVHLELLDKTKENIEKHRERLRELKRKKLEHITSSQPAREARPFQRTRRRMAPYTHQSRPEGSARQGMNGPPRQGNPVPNRDRQGVGSHQGTNTSKQASPSDLSKEVAEMRDLLNQLLLKQVQPQPRQLPPQPQMIPNNYPPAQQHPSLLTMPAGLAAAGQHPSLDSRQPQYFH